jgi:hypothetical protein
MDILYTDTDQIRSCLLLAEEDLPDTLFNQDLYERELTLHLGVWLPDHATLVSGTNQNISFALQNYCAYWAAYKVASTLAISVPQQVSDGKNMLQRSPDFVALMTAMMAGMGDARATITAELGGATTSTVTQFSVAGLAVDPVTG